MKQIDQTHEKAREIVELALLFKGRIITTYNRFDYKREFIKKHKLGTFSRPNTNHSYDIVTDKEVIEIDDYGKHSKRNQKINDGIATEYIQEYHKQFKFYRVLKEEIVDEKGVMQPTAKSYLWDILIMSCINCNHTIWSHKFDPKEEKFVCDCGCKEYDSLD